MTISKYICTVFISFSVWYSLVACSCIAPPPLCEYAQYLESRESQLIVIGSVVDELVLDTFHQIAYKIEIERVVRGAVTTGESTATLGMGLENTETEIWMLGGQSATCLRTLGGRLLIATEYDDAYFGYQPSTCLNDTYEINTANEITGYLWDRDALATIALDKLDDLLSGQCTTSVNAFRQKIENSLLVFPNPVVDKFVISRNDHIVGGLEFKLYTTLGACVLSGRLHQREVLSLEPFASGVYVLTVYQDGYNYSRLIIKE